MKTNDYCRKNGRLHGAAAFGNVLDDQAAVFHAHLVESFQFVVQRFGEIFPALNGVDEFLEAARAWRAAGGG
jgi:hypothetical protein